MTHFAFIWNAMHPQRRTKLLREAGYPPSAFNQRAFPFIPKHVQQDVERVYNRQHEPVEI